MVLKAGSIKEGTAGGHYLNIVGSDWALDGDGKERGNGPETAKHVALYKGLRRGGLALP